MYDVADQLPAESAITMHRKRVDKDKDLKSCALSIAAGMTSSPAGVHFGWLLQCHDPGPGSADAVGKQIFHG